MFRPEILAPAGNLFKLKTAVRYGADAVYIAGKRFGLRSAAENFTLGEIAEGCRFAHAHNAFVYVVLNGFLFDEELADLPPFLSGLKEAGVDALIVSDLGVVTTVQRLVDIPIHLSTQASALSSHAAHFWKSCGVKRIVLGREVSIAEAAAIKVNSGVEVEVFAHGAMCSAYSGNCTISNFTAGRDSNRGGCVQSCRFRYRLGEQGGPSAHLFSSKDLRGVSHMDRFIQGEINSLKIEGRMKSALYVAATVRTYSKARDALLAGQKPSVDALFAELDAMSHRDYSSANLVRKADQTSIYSHGENEKTKTHDLVGHVLEARKDCHVAVFLKNPLKPGEPVEMLTRYQGNICLDTTSLRDLSGTTLERANPNRVVLLSWHPLAEKDLLLRKGNDAPIHHDPALSA